MREKSELIKRLFGRPVRIYLTLWILEREYQPFYLLEAQTALQTSGHAMSAVRAEVHTLLDCGLLAETPDGNRRYYTPIRSPWWGVFEHIGTALTLSDEAATASPSTPETAISTTA
ncbi:hypothetical protein [Microbacterium sp. Bi128]|uniref:hypothetical protein n=1 Tax=Microbacterium sp. Bi128 TaxID=2821115 RepID=UPI001D7AE6DC|nr:hypothetical protein [Microbacterium sp. Bi128]CAH0137567.1 hypothetical protein SRABI128_00225 [Microbacterium sp. Bi128]